MSRVPKLTSTSVTDSEGWPDRGSAGSKTIPTSVARKPVSKMLREMERGESGVKEVKKTSSVLKHSPPFSTPIRASTLLRRQELLQSNLSLDASCSSDASSDSFCSRASTGRIGRPSFSSRRRQGIPKPEQIAAKLEKLVIDGTVESAVDTLPMKKRCAWITPNTDPAYVAFHDEEWGVPVHDDRKLFELLVMSGALAELNWPTILSKRQIFRKVFMDFDPVMVAKLNEKKLIAPGCTASTLLSEAKIRAVVENGRLILKIIQEFGSFHSYCWNFVNHKPIVSRFRYPRQVPAKTPKADSISKDLVKRGFRGVGPTVVYSFMQAAGLTNDHLLSCFRFEECCTRREEGGADGDAMEERMLDDTMELGDIDLGL